MCICTVWAPHFLPYCILKSLREIQIQFVTFSITWYSIHQCVHPVHTIECCCIFYTLSQINPTKGFVPLCFHVYCRLKPVAPVTLSAQHNKQNFVSSKSARILLVITRLYSLDWTGLDWTDQNSCIQTVNANKVSVSSFLVAGWCIASSISERSNVTCIFNELQVRWLWLNPCGCWTSFEHPWLTESTCICWERNFANPAMVRMLFIEQ